MLLQDFTEQLGSTNPTPGGGAAAGIAIALSAGCVEKAIRFSKENDLTTFINFFSKSRTTGHVLCDDDQKYFLEWQNARRLPKNTDEEKQVRLKTVDNCAKNCAKVPYRTGKLALSMLSKMKEFMPFCNPYLISDLICGVVFARSAFDASCANIKINRPYVKDHDFLAELNYFITADYDEFYLLEKDILKHCNIQLLKNQ